MLNPIDVKSLRIDGPFKHLQIGEASERPDGSVAREISCKALVLDHGPGVAAAAGGVRRRRSKGGASTTAPPAPKR